MSATFGAGRLDCRPTSLSPGGLSPGASGPVPGAVLNARDVAPLDDEVEWFVRSADNQTIRF